MFIETLVLKQFLNSNKKVFHTKLFDLFSDLIFYKLCAVPLGIGNNLHVIINVK